MISDMRTTAIHITGALILTICLGVSCRKELPAQAEGGEPVTVTATISDAPGTRVTYSEDGDKLKSAWAVGDRIVGWTEAGARLELEIASADRIVNGTAVFTTVQGSASLPSSGRIYMIYAPGKHFGEIGAKSLTVDLRGQAEGVVPALMMATGTVIDRQIRLDFENEMSIVMVKNPKFPQADPNTLVGSLVLSGENVYTSVTFGMENNALKMTPSAPGSIIKSGTFSIGTGGKPASDVTFYFAVPPTTASKEISVSSLVPEGYAFYLQNRSFVRNKCYRIVEPSVSKFQYNITTKSYDGGTFTTSPADRSPWGEEVAITIVPTSQWEFKPGTLKVTIDGSSTGVALTDNKFTMPQADVTVAGTFRKLQYKLTANTPSHGSLILKNTDTGDVISSGTSIDWGTPVTVVPTADTGYVVDKVKYTWGGNSYEVQPANSVYKFNMPTGDTSVTVTFKIHIPGTTPEYPIVVW